MAAPIKRGGSEDQSAAAAAALNGTTGDAAPRLKLDLAAAAKAKPGGSGGGDLSSSSAESFFRGFRLRFPGFAGFDPAAASAAESGEPDREDERDDGLPDAPSPVLLANKKRLYNVPAVRLKNPSNASKKLRLEGATGPRGCNAADGGTVAERIAGSFRQPIDDKLPRSNSEETDRRNHHRHHHLLLDETLASFHGIAADTSKIMAKLGTERQAVLPSENAEEVEESEKPAIAEENAAAADKSVEAERVVVTAAAADPSDESESMQTVKSLPPQVAVVAAEKFISNHHEYAASPSSPSPTLKSESRRPEMPDSGLDVEISRGSEGAATPTKVAKPSFNWSSPGSGGAGGLKVAIVSPLLNPKAAAEKIGSPSSSLSRGRGSEPRQVSVGDGNHLGLSRKPHFSADFNGDVDAADTSSGEETAPAPRARGTDKWLGQGRAVARGNHRRAATPPSLPRKPQNYPWAQDFDDNDDEAATPRSSAGGDNEPDPRPRTRGCDKQQGRAAARGGLRRAAAAVTPPLSNATRKTRGDVRFSAFLGCYLDGAAPNPRVGGFDERDFSLPRLRSDSSGDSKADIWWPVEDNHGQREDNKKKKPVVNNWSWDLSTNSDDEEEEEEEAGRNHDRGGERCRRMPRKVGALPDFRGAASSRWRTGLLGNQNAAPPAEAYRMEEIRSPRATRGPSVGGGSNEFRRRLNNPVFSTFESDSEDSADLEATSWSETSKVSGGGGGPTTCKCGSKGKKSLARFPSPVEICAYQCPGTSRMSDSTRRVGHGCSHCSTLMSSLQRNPDASDLVRMTARESRRLGSNSPMMTTGNTRQRAAGSTSVGLTAGNRTSDTLNGNDRGARVEPTAAARGRRGIFGSKIAKSKSHPSKNHGDGGNVSNHAFLRRLDTDWFDPELSDDDDEDDDTWMPHSRPRRRNAPGSSGSAARRVLRIVSSSDSEVDMEVAAGRQWLRRNRPAAAVNGGPRRRFRRIVGDMASEDEEEEGEDEGARVDPVQPAAFIPSPSGQRSHAAPVTPPWSPPPDWLDSPGELDAVHQIEQIETDEAYARRLQAEFDAEANAAALARATAAAAAAPAPPPSSADAVPSAERGFTPVRAGPSVPHRFSRNRNPSLRAANPAAAAATAAGGFRNSRPRLPSTRSPSQQSLLNASRHRSNSGRARGGPNHDGMPAAAMLPMMDGDHLNRMLLGFQDEWMSLIASVAVPTVESDPEETSRGRSPRSLRRRPAARANASSDDTDIDGILFEGLLTYSDDEDDYWQTGLRPATNQTGRNGARRRSRGRRPRGNYWTPNQDNDYEELLELAERLGHVSRGLNRNQINRLPTHQFSKAAAATDGAGGTNEGATTPTTAATTTSRATECHICMSEYESGERLRILPCFHDFHTNCIDRWLREKNTCPVCRLRVQVS